MTSKLKFFKISKLFNQYDVNLPLDQPVNIFLGENGMGKTTILNCIYFALSGNVEKLNNVLFEHITVVFEDEDEISISRNDISAYMDYVYDSHYPPYSKKRRLDLEMFFSEKDIRTIIDLYNTNPNNQELRKYYFKISEILGAPLGIARQEIQRYVFSKNISQDMTNANYEKVLEFNRRIREKIDEDILYFPTYRRIEEDMNKLGVDIGKDNKIKSKLIQFGMSDVEKNTNELQQEIKSIAITGFAKMTGVLLKQYLDGHKLNLDNYIVEPKKLSIALARVGDEIEDSDKQKIIELVNSNEIYNSKNTYLLNLIKNLIDSYERQSEYDERVKKFTTVCNNYLNGKKYIYDESNVEWGIHKDNSKQIIDMQNLSSGEKQIISVFSKLYIENTDKCIILFDEPELSLSIMWQNMFLPDVYKSGKCSTLIAVTHSPFIFENEFDDYAKDMGNCLFEIN